MQWYGGLDHDVLCILELRISSLNGLRLWYVGIACCRASNGTNDRKHLVLMKIFVDLHILLRIHDFPLLVNEHELIRRSHNIIVAASIRVCSHVTTHKTLLLLRVNNKIGSPRLLLLLLLQHINIRVNHALL